MPLSFIALCVHLTVLQKQVWINSIISRGDSRIRKLLLKYRIFYFQLREHVIVDLGIEFRDALCISRGEGGDEASMPKISGDRLNAERNHGARDIRNKVGRKKGRKDREKDR